MMLEGKASIVSGLESKYHDTVSLSAINIICVGSYRNQSINI
jgi:hypothetical protein